MKSYIVVNRQIYLKYKDEILPLNARLFSEPFFYNLKDYSIPLDLSGLENYLSFTSEIIIYATSSFIDFVNILLVLSFLNKKDYNGKVVINYVFLHEKNLQKAILINNNLTKTDYNNVDALIKSIIEEKQLPNIDFKVTGYLNHMNFYNMLIDPEKFIMCLEDVIEKYDEDIENIASYLYEKYSNMGLSKEFYLSYLEKNL